MAKYKVLEPSFISNRIVQPGEVVDIEFADGGVAGPNLEAVDPVAQAAPAKKSRKALAAEAAELQKLGFTITPPAGGDAGDLT